ncbi:MAG TPA: glutaminyl-peptide cyclotransferase [Vicinamibacterales bacterium]
MLRAGSAITAILLQACGAPEREPIAAVQAAPEPVVHGYEIVREYPHDPEAFTQGLIFRDGFLYESTGQTGRGSVRKVRLETGEVVQRRMLANEYFGEGLTDWGSQLVQLTWVSNIGFVYDLDSFKELRQFRYAGEGWGLTQDGTRLIMSDGTPNLRFLDPTTFDEQSRLNVRDHNGSVDDLNELEFVKGSIYANVWLTERIVIIAPATGAVTAWVDLTGLRPRQGPQGDDVLNGIAYDAAGDRLFVTGKLWPKLFEIRLKARP